VNPFVCRESFGDCRAGQADSRRRSR
jgi:hypothetical protein